MDTICKLLLIILLCETQAFSKSYCDLNSTIEEIYSEILQMDFQKARNKIEKSFDKNNLSLVLLEDYIDFFQLFIYEKESDYLQLKKNKDQRLNLISNSDIEEKWALFIQSEILLHWSLIHLKRDESLSAFYCISQALLKLERCHKKYPDFIYSKKSLGILHTLISTIPKEFDWAVKLVGMNSDIFKGKKELIEFIQFAEQTNNLFKSEAKAAFAYVISYLENQPTEASKYWSTEFKFSPQTPLLKFLAVKIYVRAGDHQSLDTLVNKITNVDKNKLPYLHYLCGILKLQDLNYNADQEMIQFLQKYHGQNYRKEAYQKLAWSALLQGYPKRYKMYMNQCLNNGIAVTDEDQQAQIEANLTQIPDVTLLKSRLLCDGNHSNRAYHLLVKKASSYIGSLNYIEYCYRMGRICEQLNYLNEAVGYYQETIRLDPQQKNHYSCLSLLQSGHLYEKIKSFEKACSFYQLALKSQPKLYARSLHQKAIAGQQRLHCIK